VSYPEDLRQKKRKNRERMIARRQKKKKAGLDKPGFFLLIAAF